MQYAEDHVQEEEKKREEKHAARTHCHKTIAGGGDVGDGNVCGTSRSHEGATFRTRGGAAESLQTTIQPIIYQTLPTPT